MSSIKPYASLSSKGYIYNIVEKTDRLMAVFFASDANQDHQFKGTIANLSILLKECGNDMLRLRERLQATLENYLGRMYENVVVQVDDDTTTNYSNRVNMTIKIMVTEAGQRYDVGQILTLIDGKFEKITTLNNTGKANYL
jgi:hypothetical protein